MKEEAFGRRVPRFETESISHETYRELDTPMDEAHYQALLVTAVTVQRMIEDLAKEGRRDEALEQQLRDQQQLIAYQAKLRPNETPETHH